MAKTRDIAMIHGAAFYFAYTSRDKKSIASRFGVTERTIERWSKEPDWHQALNAWGYTGERTFARVDRDIASTSRERFEQAKAIYIKAFKSGEPLHRLATITGKATGLPPSTIRRWTNRYNWKAYLEEDEIAYRESTEFIGVSKTKYPFEAHILGTEFPDIGGVYIFIKRTQIGNEFINKPLYIGEANELVGRFCDRYKFNCVQQRGGNYTYIHREKDEYSRRKIVNDLIASLNPICNDSIDRTVKKQPKSKRRKKMLIQNGNFNEILDLAIKIELEKERHNKVLDELVDELMVVAQKAEEPSMDVNWTPQKFADEKLNEELRSAYRENHGVHIEDVYRMGAEIMNFTQGWNLKCIPMVKHIFWVSGSKRLFGLNLFSSYPRYSVFYITENGDLTGEEVEKHVPNNDLIAFPQYKQLVFQRGTTSIQLSSLFEEVYTRRQ